MGPLIYQLVGLWRSDYIFFHGLASLSICWIVDYDLFSEPESAKIMFRLKTYGLRAAMKAGRAALVTILLIIAIIGKGGTL